ncbi:uncharacterized protein C8A04DRAFT_24344 [Dichotomopilus funicola]|uniref:Pal1 cell morphology n=1 Tax=Dichotomopilus funicola TaxID=1934379 RepID=A0AAN6VBB4_9PEZI|nr:hypothetical protein C8A04DRAFT_24344 [Dichotomopilus funicola]
MSDRGSDDGLPDKQWASKYILGPLYDPEPNQVCAPQYKPLPIPPSPESPARDSSSQRRLRKNSIDGRREELPLLFRSLSLSRSRSNSVKDKPLPAPPPPPRSKYPPPAGLERKRSLYTAAPKPTRWNQGTILTRASSISTPRPSADIMASIGNQTSHRLRASSLVERYQGDNHRRPLDKPSKELSTGGGTQGENGFPRRANSLRERYPGDMSHRPLAMLTKQHRAADRAPHLRTHRRQQPSDPIDTLDHTGPVPGATYHHGGPFDATLKERNLNKKYAPVDAVKETNMEALKATPVEYVQDSLVKHVPLQGTAVVPPGMQDVGGRTMEYQEGADLMREEDAEGGPYKRWDHVRYRDDDYKGKGEPAFSYDQARREKKATTAPHAAEAGTVYYEMQPTASATSRDAHASKQPAVTTATRGLRRRAASVGRNDRAGPATTAHAQQTRPLMGGSNGYYDDDEDGEEGGDYGDDEDDAWGTGTSGAARRNNAGSGGKNLAQTLKRRFGSLRKK